MLWIAHQFFKLGQAKFTLLIFDFQVVDSLMLNISGLLYLRNLFCLHFVSLELSFFYLGLLFFCKKFFAL
jgi:hypothetical protein